MKRILSPLFFLSLFFLLLLYPEQVKSGALDGLYLWYNSVVPILLPFMIVSAVMISTDSLALFLRPFFLLNKKKYRFNPWIFYPLFFGLFCGFPMGAKTISDLIQNKRMTTEEGSYLLPIVNQASPMFLAGFVGVHILKNRLSLPRILFYLYLPPFFFFFLFFFCFYRLKKKNASNFPVLSTQKNSMPLKLEHTIWNAFTSIVLIGIYMMLFTILFRLCIHLLPKNDYLSIGLCSLEFSTGLNTLGQLSLKNQTLKTGLILSLTSFGGFCTAAQTYSMIKETGISMKSYLFWKIVLAAGVFFLYSLSTSY